MIILERKGTILDFPQTCRTAETLMKDHFRISWTISIKNPRWLAQFGKSRSNILTLKESYQTLLEFLPADEQNNF